MRCSAAEGLDLSTERLDPVALRRTYRRDLFDDYLPFLDRYVVDHELGGFLCACSPLGERLSDRKRTWYEGRGMWTYAFLYREFTRDQRHLDVALRSHALLRRSRPATPTEARPVWLRRDGTADGPPDPQVYGDLFVAEGLAELGRATGGDAFRREAIATLLCCMERYDSPSYAPDIGRTYFGADAPALPGARVLGVWMVVLRIVTQLLEARPDDELERLADRVLSAVLDAHLNPRLGLLNELVHHDLSRAHGRYERFVYLGHAIEVLWMVLAEARRRGDPRLFDRAAGLFRRHCEVARDRVHGGLFRSLVDADTGWRTSDKTLFVHQEAMLGALLLVEETNDPWAARFHRQVDAYTRSVFPLTSVGSPMWRLRGDRRMRSRPDERRVENYHHPRYLMYSLLAVEQGGTLGCP